MEEGDRATLTFRPADYYQPVTMRVARLGGNEAGSRLPGAVVRPGAAERDAAAAAVGGDRLHVLFRAARPEIPPSVSKMVKTGVYILEGTLAKWKPITILHDTGESYVVTLDTSSTNNLWPGDELIINAKNLYDGKVVN